MEHLLSGAHGFGCTLFIITAGPSPKPHQAPKTQRQVKDMWWGKKVQIQNLIIKWGSRVSKQSSCAKTNRIASQSSPILPSWAGRSVFHHAQPQCILHSTAAVLWVTNNTWASCVTSPKRSKPSTLPQPVSCPTTMAHFTMGTVPITGECPRPSEQLSWNRSGSFCSAKGELFLNLLQFSFWVCSEGTGHHYIFIPGVQGAFYFLLVIYLSLCIYFTSCYSSQLSCDSSSQIFKAWGGCSGCFIVTSLAAIMLCRSLHSAPGCNRKSDF